MRIIFYLLSFFVVITSCSDSTPPLPFGAVPSSRQSQWEEMEYYGFLHFNMNTFTDREWGNGDESPTLFNPKRLDCKQWAKTAKMAGMKGLIITAKHHDGFCLWPSEYTEHSVKNSPWKNGNGDVIRELAKACKEYGLKLGIYLSPWDRNHPDYGKPEYLTYFRNQLKELLTDYGDIFEVWFDGANGGTGYYGGANENRKVDRESYYDWNTTINMVRELQPNAVIFSDAGPDVRWIGNERGFTNNSVWSTLNRDEFYPGSPNYEELTEGHVYGTHWVPAEVDVSLRPGWYYHKNEDSKVKSVEHLEWIYYHSVGNNGSALINIPITDEGLVHPNDSTALLQLADRLKESFKEGKLKDAKINSSNTRGNADIFSANNLLDGMDSTYWATDDNIKKATLEVSVPQPVTVNIVEIKEYTPLGQRVSGFSLEGFYDGKWKLLARGNTIGRKKLIRINDFTGDKFRLNIDSALASPVLSGFQLYHSPHPNYLLEQNIEKDERMAWWREAKFGMFIHWGAYAIPGGIYQGKEVPGIGEWIMDRAKIPKSEYEKYVQAFNPIQFEAEKWVGIAKKAGMKYIVITSKHHDGFCLWDSETSDYDVMDASPYKKDILKALADACKKEGIKLGFYHSIMDWHHPLAKGEDFSEYRDTYLKPQLKELIVNNKDISILWFDGEWIGEWTEDQGKDLYQYVRSLKPDILINNRVGKGRNGMQGMNRSGGFVGDYGTPEQEILESGSSSVDWETCMTMNDTWGFKYNDHNWKSATLMVHQLIDAVIKGGNYLLNVGPDAQGLIPEPSVQRLNEIGQWLEINGEAIYGTTMAEVIKEGNNLKFGINKGSIYVFSLLWNQQRLPIKSIRPKEGSRITLLGYEKNLNWSYSDEEGLEILIPDEIKPGIGGISNHAWVFKIDGEFVELGIKN